MLLMVGFIAIAQDTTTVAIDYVEGQPILDFLKANWMGFALLVYSVAEYWVGKTKLVQENSFIAVIFGMLGKWLKKKK